MDVKANVVVIFPKNTSLQKVHKPGTVGSNEL
jgi:hypothetical protein